MSYENNFNRNLFKVSVPKQRKRRQQRRRRNPVFPTSLCFVLGPKVQGEKVITEWLLNSVSEVLVTDQIAKMKLGRAKNMFL